MIRSTRNEDLRVGDLVHVLGVKRITAILPYRGPLACIFAIVNTVPGVGFSLERGGYTDRYEPDAVDLPRESIRT